MNLSWVVESATTCQSTIDYTKDPFKEDEPSVEAAPKRDHQRTPGSVPTRVTTLSGTNVSKPVVTKKEPSEKSPLLTKLKCSTESSKIVNEDYLSWRNKAYEKNEPSRSPSSKGYHGRTENNYYRERTYQPSSYKESHQHKESAARPVKVRQDRPSTDQGSLQPSEGNDSKKLEEKFQDLSVETNNVVLLMKRVGAMTKVEESLDAVSKQAQVRRKSSPRVCSKTEEANTHRKALESSTNKKLHEPKGKMQKTKIPDLKTPTKSPHVSSSVPDVNPVQTPPPKNDFQQKNAAQTMATSTSKNVALKASKYTNTKASYDDSKSVPESITFGKLRPESLKIPEYSLMERLS